VTRPASGNDPDAEFARPFNVTTADGELYHCVEFPTTGLVVLASPERGLVSVHASVEVLLAFPDMQGATVERPEDANLAGFRQWLIDNGGAMRLALDAADLTDAEVEARLAAAHAQAERYDAERAQVAAEFGVRPDQITLRGCHGERGEE
jgi:hypothetical protein